MAHFTLRNAHALEILTGQLMDMPNCILPWQSWTNQFADRSTSGNCSKLDMLKTLSVSSVSHTYKALAHTHNRFTALLEFVRDYPGEQVPER